MKTLLISLLGMSLVLSGAGCADIDTSNAAEDSTAAVSQNIGYTHLWDVYKLTNGANRVDYYPPNDVAAVQDFGLPVAMWDSGNDPSANSGRVYYQMTPGGSWGYMDLSDFSNYFTVVPMGGVVTKHQFYIYKPLNSGNWQATWGQGGPWGSFGYYAKYGQ